MTEYQYPTKKQLKYIEDYDVSKRPVAVLLDYIKDLTWFPSFCWEIKDHKEKLFDNYTIRSKRLYYSTAGWSGNEDIIRALRKNELFWLYHWYQSRRGGHYIFDFNEEGEGRF